MPRRRSWLERSLSALFAVWLAFLVAEPAALHSCPMHGGHGIAASQAGPPGLALGATAADHHHPAPQHEHGAPADRESGNRYCSCLGQCSAGSAVAAIPGAAVRLTDVVVRQARVALPSGDTRAELATEHVLPFANGPPRA